MKIKTGPPCFYFHVTFIPMKIQVLFYGRRGYGGTSLRYKSSFMEGGGMGARRLRRQCASIVE
jgi:hypothetical protein